MRILLLGANGFAGSHFRKVARAAGHEVVGTARSPGTAELTCEITDPASVDAAVRAAEADAIANLAGFSSVGASLAQPMEAFDANANGTLNLLAAVAEHSPQAHVLCVSSGEVYGLPGPEELPLTEDRPTEPANPYGASKAAMEGICEQFAGEGARIAVIRAFNHTGPGQGDDFVASSFARQVAETLAAGAGVAELATGNLTPARDFTDVRDMVRAYVTVLESGITGTFNACSGKAMKIERFIDLLADASGIPVRAVPDPARMRPVDAPVLYGSHERLTKAVGWRSQIPIEQTVADLLTWWSGRLAGAA